MKKLNYVQKRFGRDGGSRDRHRHPNPTKHDFPNLFLFVIFSYKFVKNLSYHFTHICEPYSAYFSSIVNKIDLK
jgi:hypothetical protein